MSKVKRIDFPYNCGNCKRWKKKGDLKDGTPIGICTRKKSLYTRNWDYCVGVEQRRKSRAEKEEKGGRKNSENVCRNN